MSNERLLTLVVTLLVAYLLVSSYLLYVFVSRSKKTQPWPASELGNYLLETEADNNRSADAYSFSGTTAVYSQQELRRKLISDGCRSEERWSASRIKNASRRGFALLVDDGLRYVYCRVAKVASTTWSRVLLVASGKVKAKNPNKLSQSAVYAHLRDDYPLRRLSRYTPEEIEYRLKHYFKFMFVRHPFDRLVSAFKDRLKSNHMIPRRLYAKRIIRNYRQPGDIPHDKGVQFREFVRYLVDPATSRSGFNAHWRPQTNVCLPCQIDYDFIGHYETLSSDAGAVLIAINSSSPSVLPPGLHYPTNDPDNRHPDHYNSSRRLTKMFADIDRADIHALKSVVYAKDFRLFGYQ